MESLLELSKEQLRALYVEERRKGRELAEVVMELRVGGCWCGMSIPSTQVRHTLVCDRLRQIVWEFGEAPRRRRR